MIDDAASPAPEQRPPRPRLCLIVGLIGQTEQYPGANAMAERRAVDMLARIRFDVERTDPLPWYTAGRMDLRIISGLMNNSEHEIVNSAIKAGFALDVVQQPGADVAQLPATARRLILSCKSEAEATGDVLLREAIISHSSLIIAVWDGAGRCSAAEAVHRALACGVPIIHIPIDTARPPRLLLSETADARLTPDIGDIATAEPCTPAVLTALLETILLPPQNPDDRAQLRQFLDEPFYAHNLRIGYPLLLAATGTQRLRRKSWNKALYPADVKQEWAKLRALGGDHARANQAMLARLEESFLWANHLGSHFAQTMRSALVINFSFSALAVLAALAGLATTTFKLPLALTEIFIIAVIILNIRRGNRQTWQRRWLDYRSIAERLRPIRSLKLLGIASQPRRVERKGTGNRRWIDWYVAAIWREMGLPQGVIDAPQLDRLRRLVAEGELSGEIAYHRTNARRMRHLEDRLHLVGDACFLATLLVCTLFPILYLAAYQLAMAWSTGFVMLSAGLPAIGGAIYALRVHGDYGGAAGRSLETAEALDRLRTAILAPDVSLAQVGELTRAAARVMLVDLDEWQLTYAQRSLAIPS